MTHPQPHHDLGLMVSTHQQIILTEFALLLTLQYYHMEVVILSMVTLLIIIMMVNLIIPLIMGITIMVI